jgi:RimJ/RimL family protein N-acetyltransferase
MDAALLRTSCLETRHCSLEPLQQAHHDALCAAAAIDQLWRSPYTYVPDRDEMRRYIANAEKASAGGSAMAYAIRLRHTGEIVGTTRYQFINWTNRRLQVGGTWLGAPWRRTFVNTECKHALLQQAFEGLGFQRVEFCVDVHNHASRRAVERLGAQLEGVLRNHLCLRGRKRDSAVYSCIDDDWPEIKRRLASHGADHQ